MGNIAKTENPSAVLTALVETLSMASTLPAITKAVAESARLLTGADGSTFVLREGNKCYYVDENAIEPLWKGLKFPLEACISGWSMLNKQTVVIQDIYEDSRIPHDAYRPTFVKSLCMVPIRQQNPIGAIGNYWANGYCPSQEEIKLLQVLANSTSIALENLELKTSLQKFNDESQFLQDREKQLETALHTMAHNLKHPLTAMMGFAELLQIRLQDQLDDKLNGYFRSILKTGYQANESIKKMLALYSVSQSKIDKQTVNITLMCQELAEQFKMNAPDRKITVDIAEDLTVYADFALLNIVLENLMSNAFKFTSKKVETVIRFGHHDETHSTVTFFISDNGVGWDPAYTSKLFHPLERLHSESEFPGTGLGLSSVARILELHGGSIRAEASLNQGAVFYFTLPKH